MPKIRVWETSPDRTLRRASSESASLRRRHAAARSAVRSGPARPRPSPANWRGLSLRRAACGGSGVFTALRSRWLRQRDEWGYAKSSVRRVVYPRGYEKSSDRRVVYPGDTAGVKCSSNPRSDLRITRGVWGGRWSGSGPPRIARILQIPINI